MLEIMWKNLSALFVLFLTCFCVTKSQSCIEDEYGYVNIKLTCTNGTRSFPTNITHVNVLECLDCNIPVLNTDTIIKNFNGERFNLSNSHVQIISENVFDGFSKNMRQFIFDYNEIGYIAPQVFSKFTKLEEISIRNSKISKLDAGVFNDTFVTELTLSENLFSSIDHIFDGLKVTRLNLSSNIIRELAIDSFAKTKFIKGNQFPFERHLDLSNNLIQKIHSGAFNCYDPNYCVQILQLNKNAIIGVKNNTFSDLRCLLVLYLSDNAISELETDSFKGLNNLKELSLRNNRIDKIPVSLFADLQRLDVLDLSGNLLCSVELNVFSGLIALSNLNISHNNLKTFNHLHIFPLGKLTDLDISDIKLHNLDLKPMLQHNSRLRTLIINDNFWVCPKLLEMYAQMNLQFNGFSSPSHHFNVPNLHGIACSREKLKSYDKLSFYDFLKVISKDGLSTDWLNVEYIMEDEDASNDTNISSKYIRNIHSMFVFVVVVTVIVLTFGIVKLILRWLRDNHFLRTNRFSFMYKQEQQNVQVCS